MDSEEIVFRTQPVGTDVASVRKICESTGFFRPDEVDVAVELVQERLEKGEESGYYFIFAELKGQMVGYVCYGPIPCSLVSHDLYWIVVDNTYRNNGLGKKLVNQTLLKVKESGGLKVFIETSSTPLYEPTRQFYLRAGCLEEARLKDFYSKDDDKVIFSLSV